jgi:hypothetical protein
LLSWFDEPSAVLGQCLTGLQYAGIDHVVAVDGRYELFPGEEYVSSAEQQGLVALACRTLGMGCTLYMPPATWPGEVEKRNHMFNLALSEAYPGDWFVVVDADVVITNVPLDLKEQLERAEQDVATVTVRDMSAAVANRPDWPEYFDLRPFFRAQPIQTLVNHHTYTALDGRVLWAAKGEDGEVEPALDLRQAVEFQHRPGSRGQDRQLKQAAYYGSREDTGAERHWCEHCLADEGVRVKAVKRVPVRWRRTDAGIVSDIAELCESHKKTAEDKNRKRMRTWGILCSCRAPHVAKDGLCRSCHKPVRPETAYRVIERNGRPQIGVKP